MPRYWEDYAVGEEFTTPGRTVTDAMISVIIGLGGFTVPFFWDEEEAKKTVFGTRIAPGRLTLLLMGGLEEQSGFWDHQTIGALLGIDKVRLKGPLKAGDTIRVEGEVIEKRETRNPDMGIIISRSVCRNQKGEVLMEAQTTHLVKRRVQETVRVEA